MVVCEKMMLTLPETDNWIESIQEKSVFNFKQYGSCTQSLLGAFLETFEIEHPLLLRATGAMHSGLMSSLTCGIHVAGMMVLGIFIGREKIEHGLDGLLPIVHPGQKLMKRLNSRIESHSCKELTGVDFTDLDQALDYYVSGEREKCIERISIGAEEIAEFLSELSKKGELHRPI